MGWPFRYGSVAGAPFSSPATLEPRFGSSQQPYRGPARKLPVDVLTRVTPAMIQTRIGRWQAILACMPSAASETVPRYTFGELLYSRDDGAPIGRVIGIIRRQEWEYLIRQADGAAYDLPESYFMNEAERAA
ncbi:MAG TPA: hypothetical protein VFZ66_17205 [Herpetosiphonaceae bacterium]